MSNRELAADALDSMLDTLKAHRGLTEEQIEARLAAALANANGLYMATGRLPDEVIGYSADGEVVLKPMNRPPRFDSNGYAIPEEAPKLSGMNIKQALDLCTRGRRVTREAWKQAETMTWLCLPDWAVALQVADADGDAEVKNGASSHRYSGKVFAVTHELLRAGNIRSTPESVSFIAWSPSTEDALAEDWRIVADDERPVRPAPATESA